MFVLTDESGRITATSERFHLGEGEMTFEFPVDFDFLRQTDWRIVKGALIHDPLPLPEPEKNAMDELAEQVRLLREQLQALTTIP